MRDHCFKSYSFLEISSVYASATKQQNHPFSLSDSRIPSSFTGIDIWNCSMDSDIFSADPKSFKTPRKSPLAKKLKSTITDKLPDFLGNYTDDVLAEYITVVVCNGKHQYQARDDLEAFLGENSTEFVSWLWDLLVKQNYQSVGGTDHWPKDVSITDNEEIEDSRPDGSKDIDKSAPALDDDSVTKDAKMCDAYAPATVQHSDIKQASGIQQRLDYVIHSSEIKAKEVIPKATGHEKEIPTVCVAKSSSGSLMHRITRKVVPSLVSSGAEQGVQMHNKLRSGKQSGLPSQPPHAAKGEEFSENLRSSITGDPCSRQASMNNVPERSLSPRSPGRFGKNDKPRVSVWDRLGKPTKNVSKRNNKDDAQGVNISKKVILNEGVPVHRLRSGKFGKEPNIDVPKLASKYDDGSCPVEDRILGHGAVPVSDLHVASNISRKRHFGKMNSVVASGPDSAVDLNERYVPHKETSKDSKRIKSTSADPKAVSSLVFEVLDVKQRIRQIEEEMSKLRSKQLGIEKDGKADPSSHSGDMNHQEEDNDSRTVLVSNVHYAATREALSLYFAWCGPVVNVSNLTDQATGQGKSLRSAYVTFSSKECVDKALALSGSTFFSRTIKVVRKAEAAAVASPVSQLSGKPYEVQTPYTNKMFVPSRPSHLRWRRESTILPKPPAPTMKDKRAVQSAS